MNAAFLPYPPGTTPQNIRLVMPQCDAQRVGIYLCDKPGQDKRCHHSAKFLVGERNLCTRHAEIAALAYLMGQTEAAAASTVEHHPV